MTQYSLFHLSPILHFIQSKVGRSACLPSLCLWFFKFIMILIPSIPILSNNHHLTSFLSQCATYELPTIYRTPMKWFCNVTRVAHICLRNYLAYFQCLGFYFISCSNIYTKVFLSAHYLSQSYLRCPVILLFPFYVILCFLFTFNAYNHSLLTLQWYRNDQVHIQFASF